MTQQNTARLWDSVWARAPSVEKDLYAVAKEERLIRWQRMEAMILERFGTFENLSVIELGAGRGTNAALMAGRGARVSVLDYSELALERSRRLFENLELPVQLVLQDALELPAEMVGRYDVSMSFGLAEHFLGEPRRAIVKAHFDVLRPGGLAFVSVPNAYNPPYRLYKWITERTGRWTIGEEYPFARTELESQCARFGITEYGFFGDSLWRSKKFLNPLKWLPRRKRKKSSGGAAPPASEAGSVGTHGGNAAGETGTPAAQTGTPAAETGTPATETGTTAAETGTPATETGTPATETGTPAAEAGASSASNGRSASRGKRRYRSLPRKEKGTRWDDRYSYALVLWGVKPGRG